MTEVQKYQGLFIQKQRELKQQLKLVEKESKGENVEVKKKKKSLRRYLGDEGKFQGWTTTAKALLADVRRRSS